MKSRLFVPVMLVVFLAGSSLANGQDPNQKKIDRLQRKIEKQSKKLQELTGEEIRTYSEIAPPVTEEEIEKIREEALALAEEAEEDARESMEAQREAFEAQREAMMEKKRDLDEMMIVIRKRNAEKMEQIKELNRNKMEDLRELKEKEIEVWKDLNGKNYHYYFRSPNWRAYKDGALILGDDGDIKIDIPEINEGVYGVFKSGQNVLSIEKKLTDESSSADFNYEVKEGAYGMSVRVSGAIDAGKVKILIKQPDGEVYNEYTLSSLANVKWHQNIKFNDLEESEYLGKWTVNIVAEKAKGTYSVQIRDR